MMHGTISGTRRLGRGLLAGLTVAIAGWAMPTPATAAPAALNQAAGDAEVVLLAKNLKQLNQKVNQFKEAAAPPMMAMMAPQNGLKALKGFMGVKQGFDNTGSLLVSISGVADAMEQGGRPEAAIVLPVSDYQALAQGLGGKPGGVSKVSVFKGKPGFIRDLGNGHAVLARRKGVVKNYQPGGNADRLAAQAGAIGGQALNDADIALWADMNELGPLMAKNMKKRFKQRRKAIKQQIEQGMANPGKMMGFNLVASSMTTFLQDAEAAVVGLDVNKPGLGLSLAVQHKPGSAIGEYLSAGEGQLGAMLDRLPAQDFLFAGGYDGEGLAVNKVINELSGKFLGVMKKQNVPGGEQNPVIKIINQWVDLQTQKQAMAAAWYLPSAQGMQKHGLKQIISLSKVANTGDHLNKHQKLFNSLSMVAPAAAAGAQGGPPPGQDGGQGPKINYESGAVNIDVNGQTVKANRYSIEANMPPGAMQQMGPMKMVTGGDSLTGLIAGRDGYVVNSTTADEALFASALGQVGQAGGLGQSPGMTKLGDKALPPSPVGAMYVSFSGLGKLANRFAPMMGLGGQGQGKLVNMPNDLPPLAIGLGAEQDGVAARLYLPTESAKFATTAGMKGWMKFKQQMQQGGGGQPGHGGPGGPGNGGTPPAPPVN